MLYVHPAGVVMVPLYAAITFATLVGCRKRRDRDTVRDRLLAAAAPWALSMLRDS